VDHIIHLHDETSITKIENVVVGTANKPKIHTILFRIYLNNYRLLNARKNFCSSKNFFFTQKVQNSM